MNQILKKYLISFLKYILGISVLVLLILSFYLITTLIFYDQNEHNIDKKGMFMLFLIPISAFIISKYSLKKIKKK